MDQWCIPKTPIRCSLEILCGLILCFDSLAILLVAQRTWQLLAGQDPALMNQIELEEAERYHGSARPHSTLKAALNEIVFGSLAGMVGKIMEHPFDLVKVRVQSQPLDQPLRFKGPADCALQTIRSEGLLGLYQGISMPLIGAMLENATLFVVYNRLHPFTDEYFSQTPLASHVVSGAAAGSCASFALTPVELVKCKLQVQAIAKSDRPNGAPLNARSVLKGVLKTQGVRGLWTGQLGTFIRESGGTAAWFTTFEMISDAFLRSTRSESGEQTMRRSQLPAWQLGVAGASAGVAYNTILYPADCIKSNMQTADELLGPHQPRKSFIQTGKDIFRARGLRGLYQGCGVNSLRSMPSSGLVFVLYSKLEDYFSA